MTDVKGPARRGGSIYDAARRTAKATLVNGLIIAAGLVLSGVLLALTGADVPAATQALIEGSVGSPEAIRQSLIQATPILIAGLGVSFALRAGLVNIGADGQLYMGALFAAVVAIFGPALPSPLALIVLLGASVLGGLLWGALPGWMRGYLGMNEVITTLLLNFVAFWIVSYAVHGPIQDPTGGGYPWTAEVPAVARLAVIRLGPIPVPSGIVLGLILAVVVSFVLHRTQFGFELRVLGDSPAAARWAGVKVPVRIVQTLAISGALAGLAGAAELAGNQYRLSDFFSPNFGFTALVVALVGRATPSGTVAAALFFGALTAGASSMEEMAHVPASTGLIVQGVVIAILVASRSPVARVALTRLRLRGARLGRGTA